MNPILADYLSAADSLLREIAGKEEQALLDGAKLLSDAFLSGKTIYIFGCTHSAILAEDVFYRAGAPAFWRPLWGPGMSIATTPGVLTTAMEHSEEVGRQIVECSQIGAGDVLTVISTSGKNAAPLAVAETALQRGAKVIALTSSAYRNERGNHPRIANLWVLADRVLLIDNHVPQGDASILSPGCPMGPLSTIAGSFILHSLSALCVERLIAAGRTAPVFMSSNTPGGAEHNAELLKDSAARTAFFLP